MKVWFSDQGFEDYLYWQEHDLKILAKINRLLQEIARTPFTGTGKPEALKHLFSGCWSRRIDQTHRLVYRYEDGMVKVYQCRYHY